VSSMTYDVLPEYSITRVESHWVIGFKAMASPCEVLVRSPRAHQVEEMALLAYAEAMRIEHKFSRYRTDNVIHTVNHSGGQSVTLDPETTQLLNYAGECYKLSDGLFDITSGVLRKAWTFEGKEVQPDQNLIASLLELVGWEKVEFSGDRISLRPGMEIDLGGVGKEYAVDRVAHLLYEAYQLPLMVNFGGDVRAVSPGPDAVPWRVGIENPDRTKPSIGISELVHGAVATSGLSYRHCFVNGRRLGHILNPHTGWPVEDPPQSVTVLGEFCTEAGLLTTVAMLHGPQAEQFLDAQEVRYHCVR
jgi:FAD:protein FMN transferase